MGFLDSSQAEENLDYGFISNENLVLNAARKINSKILRLEDIENDLQTKSDLTESHAGGVNEPEEVSLVFKTLFGVSFPVSFIDTELLSGKYDSAKLGMYE